MPDLNERAEQIVETAFAAAIDDSLWQDLTEQIISVIDSKGTFFGLVDHSIGEPKHTVFTNANARARDEYFAGMGRQDPQLLMVTRARCEVVYTDRDHLNWADPVTADYMNWQIDRLGWHRHVAVAARLDSKHCFALSFHFGKGEADRTEKARRFLVPVSHALTQAIQLGFLHNQKLAQEYWLGAAAAIDSHSSFLIGDSGKVIRMNAMAERLASESRHVALIGGRIRCHSHEDQTNLEAAINGAIAVTSPQPSVLMLRGLGEDKWLARTSPIVRKRRYMVIDEPAALLTLRCVESPGTSQAEMWRELFGLTVTESKVADHLRQGVPAETIARRLGMGVGTVRSHTKMIHDKTATRRNAELAHLLTLLAGER